jgi:hypothetical protein
VRIQDPGGLYDTQSFMVTVSEVVEKYAVIVGISDYKSISDLSYCDEDANAWYAYLISQGYVCLVYGDNTSSYLKYDGLASEYNVRNAIANIVGLADSDDYIVVVISGHGGGDGSGNSYACMWDCDAGELGYDGIYRDVELAADFEDCVAGQLFVFFFFDTCYSGGMNEVVSSSRIGQVYLSATCGEDGYGWDLGAYQHGAWTQFFLKWGLEGSGHESWDMSNCHGQAYIEYQTYYLTNIGSIDDWTEPDQHDNPEEFDSHPGTAVNL